MHTTQGLSVGAAIISVLGGSTTVWPTAQPPGGQNTTAELTHLYYPAIADCVEYIVPVSITFESLVFNYTIGRMTTNSTISFLLRQRALVPGSRASSTGQRRVSGFQSQVNDQVEVLRGLASIVRGGQYTSTVGIPDKLALMGFSFGSYVTHHAIANYPEIADAVVLTGIGFNVAAGVNGNGLVRSFVPRIASVQNAQRFGDLDNGYLTWVDGFARINT
ncbi:hypothetical protein LTR08_007538 [Meristemomyces frigidus]|nr:hypothetical protein LTR08_007538 [Meristemomyces frigidus]